MNPDTITAHINNNMKSYTDNIFITIEKILMINNILAEPTYRATILDEELSQVQVEIYSK